MKEKMTEEELQERYEKEQAENIDSEKISTKSGNSEALKRHKIKDLWLKSTSVIVLVTTITAAGVKFSNSYNGGDVIPEEPTTSQGGPETTDPQEDLEYVFVQPFSINDDDSVKKTIDAVNEKNQKIDGHNEVMTKRMLAYFNGTLTKEDFGDMSDDDIIKEIREYVIVLFGILSENVTGYVNFQAGEKITYNLGLVNGSENSISKDSEFYSYAKELDTILNNQLKAIATSSSEDYSTQFMDLSEKIWSDSKMPSAEKAALTVAFNAYKVLFKSLTKEQIDELQANQDNTATLSLNEILQKLSLKPKTDFDKTGKDKTSNGYNPKDKDEANKLAGSTGEDETKLVNKGGKPIKDNKGNKETVSEPTTKTSISEKPADVPDKELDKPTETDKGGEVVSTTKEVETTKKIQEEIVEPETETTTKVTTTEEIVDVKDENGDTVLTDDEYNKLKRENLKNALINREMAMLGGVAGLALMSFTFSDKIITASEKISAKIKRKRR